MIDRSDVIRRAQKHLETQLDDETIMMHLDSGLIYAMADTANEIWARLREPVAFGTLIEHMTERFDVDQETCVRQVADFIGELEKLNVVVIEPAAA